MNPQLMPFHISHTGPAPISTFFRVREQEEPSFAGPVDGVSGSGIHETAPKPSLRKRFVSAFRGRQVIGTDIPLPAGYAGVIFRFEMQSRPAPKPKSSAKARNVRGSRLSKAIAAEEEPEEDMDVDGDLLKSGEDDERETKLLQPVQTFDAIRVWNADLPVDEGRDEYIRSLREWTTLAASVRAIAHHDELASHASVFRFIGWKTFDTLAFVDLLSFAHIPLHGNDIC